MTTSRPMTPEEHKRGYVVCECGEFAHVFRAEVLRNLPEGYRGELCKQCDLWMCRVNKIHPSEATPKEGTAT